MLEIINFEFQGSNLTMTVLIEGNKDEAYKMTVDASTEKLTVLYSEIPEASRIYERQARTALRKYFGKKLPQKVVSMWC